MMSTSTVDVPAWWPERLEQVKASCPAWCQVEHTNDEHWMDWPDSSESYPYLHRRYVGDEGEGPIWHESHVSLWATITVDGHITKHGISLNVDTCDNAEDAREVARWLEQIAVLSERIEREGPYVTA